MTWGSPRAAASEAWRPKLQDAIACQLHCGYSCMYMRARIWGQKGRRFQLTGEVATRAKGSGWPLAVQPSQHRVVSYEDEEETRPELMRTSTYRTRTVLSEV